MAYWKLILILLVFATFAAVPWLGVYRDYEDQSCRVFIKHRPSLHLYFQTDVQIGNSLHDCPPEIASRARKYTEFVVYHAGYDRSIGLPGL